MPGPEEVPALYPAAYSAANPAPPGWHRYFLGRLSGGEGEER